MAAQKTLSILIVVLSIACTLGKSTEVSNEVESSQEEAQHPKYQLLLYTLETAKTISLEYINEAKNISNDILKDDALLARSSSVEIQAFKKNITEFMDKYNKYEQLEEIFELVELFAEDTEFYMTLPNEVITPDTVVIIAALKKYGSDKLEKKYDVIFLEFIEKFKRKFEETREFLKEEKAMLDWFDNFRTITNSEQQIAAFEKFFTLF